jgi:hypothetical protein
MFYSRPTAARSFSRIQASDVPELDSESLSALFWSGRKLLLRPAAQELCRRIDAAARSELEALISLFAHAGADQWKHHQRQLLATTDRYLEYAYHDPIWPFRIVTGAISERAQVAVNDEAAVMLRAFNSAVGTRINIIPLEEFTRQKFSPKAQLSATLDNASHGYDEILKHVRNQYAYVLGFGVMQEAVKDAGKESTTLCTLPSYLVSGNAGAASSEYVGSFLLERPYDESVAFQVFTERIRRPLSGS